MRRRPLQDVLEWLPVETLRLFHSFQAELSSRLQSTDTLRRALDFLDFQHRRGLPFDEISQELLDDYIVDHGRRSPNRTTRKHYRSVLRHWLRFLHRRQLVFRDWHTCLESQARGKTLPRGALSYPEVKRILQAPNLAEPQGILYRAILELLYGCALRRAEVLRIDLGDIDLADGTLIIRVSKNTEPRVLPLTRLSREMLRRYLEEVRPRFSQEVSGDAFFLEENGGRLTFERLHSFRMALQRRLKFPFNNHQLRHSCATHLLQAGLDVVTIKAFLGHRSLAATKLYTHLTLLDLRRTYDATHPRA